MNGVKCKTIDVIPINFIGKRTKVSDIRNTGTLDGDNVLVRSVSFQV